jgi:hypothetical protein
LPSTSITGPPVTSPPVATPTTTTTAVPATATRRRSEPPVFAADGDDLKTTLEEEFDSGASGHAGANRRGGITWAVTVILKGAPRAVFERRQTVGARAQVRSTSRTRIPTG